MKRRQFLIFFFLFFLATDLSYAGAVLYRMQRMKAMRQQQYQMELQQNQQGQGAQDQGQQAQGQQAEGQQTYQQMVDQRNQAIAQAILNAHNQAVPSQEAMDNAYHQQGAVSPAVSAPTVISPGTSAAAVISPVASIPAAPSSTEGSADVKDVVDLSEVWKKLDTKSTVWPLLIDEQAKLLTVSEYIGRFQAQGVQINQSPVHYMQMIDQISQSNPQILDRPFGELLRILAIVEYDFDNGIDKDVLARKVLGQAVYEANKKRFTR